MVRAYIGFKPARADDTLAELTAIVGRSGAGVRRAKISDLPDWAKPKWPMSAN